jgi:hypothetical protein
VPTYPLRIRLPETCPKCGVLGRVRPENTIQGGTVTLTWCCHACTYEWPIADAERELPERRTGQTDRRRLTRDDRRKRRRPS